MELVCWDRRVETRFVVALMRGVSVLVSPYFCVQLTSCKDVADGRALLRNVGKRDQLEDPRQAR